MVQDRGPYLAIINDGICWSYLENIQEYYRGTYLAICIVWDRRTYPNVIMVKELGPSLTTGMLQHRGRYLVIRMVRFLGSYLTNILKRQGA